MSTKKQYELVYIVAPEATEEQLAALNERWSSITAVQRHDRSDGQLGPPQARLPIGSTRKASMCSM